jgi:type IV secretory pathway VirB2 component (pilin)
LRPAPQLRHDWKRSSETETDVRGKPTHFSRAFQVLPERGDINSFAVVVLVMVIGIAAYMWWTGRLRTLAGLLTVAGIVAFLVYLSFFASQPPA